MAYETVVIPYHVWHNAYTSFAVEPGTEVDSEIIFDKMCGLHFLAFIPIGDEDPELEFRICDRHKYTWAVIQYGF